MRTIALLLCGLSLVASVSARGPEGEPEISLASLMNKRFTVEFESDDIAGAFSAVAEVVAKDYPGFRDVPVIFENAHLGLNDQKHKAGWREMRLADILKHTGHVYGFSHSVDFLHGEIRFRRPFAPEEKFHWEGEFRRIFYVDEEMAEGLELDLSSEEALERSLGTKGVWTTKLELLGKGGFIMQGVRSQIDLLEMWIVTRGAIADPRPEVEQAEPEPGPDAD